MPLNLFQARLSSRLAPPDFQPSRADKQASTAKLFKTAAGGRSKQWCHQRDKVLQTQLWPWACSSPDIRSEAACCPARTFRSTIGMDVYSVEGARKQDFQCRLDWARLTVWPYLMRNQRGGPDRLSSVWATDKKTFNGRRKVEQADPKMGEKSQVWIHKSTVFFLLAVCLHKTFSVLFFLQCRRHQTPWFAMHNSERKFTQAPTRALVSPRNFPS